MCQDNLQTTFAQNIFQDCHGSEGNNIRQVQAAFRDSFHKNPLQHPCQVNDGATHFQQD